MEIKKLILENITEVEQNTNQDRDSIEMGTLEI